MRIPSHVPFRPSPKIHDLEPSDRRLLDAMATIRRRTVVNRKHDIPAVAGYPLVTSRAYNPTFIDRDLPNHFTCKNGRVVFVDGFLVLHEQIEKSLIDQLGLNYQEAHQIALRAEREAVRAAGIPWGEYDAFMQKYIASIEKKFPRRFPRNLDLAPYRDEADASGLAKIREALARRHVHYVGGDALLDPGLRKDYGVEKDWLVSNRILLEAMKTIAGRRRSVRVKDLMVSSAIERRSNTVLLRASLPALVESRRGEMISLAPLLVMGRAVEEALRDQIGIPYASAREIGLRTMRQAARALKVDWDKLVTALS